jgi:hypothetical protein
MSGCYGYVGLKTAKNGCYHIQMYSFSFITRVHNLIVVTKLHGMRDRNKFENKFESHLTFLFRGEKICVSTSTESPSVSSRLVPKSFFRKSNLPRFINIFLLAQIKFSGPKIFSPNFGNFQN